MCIYIYICIYTHIYGTGKLSRYSDLLRTGRSGDRISVGARFSGPVQTLPGAHPASYKMGTGSFPRVRRPGLGVDHPPTSSAEVKERVELYLYSPFGPSWPVVRCSLPLPLYIYIYIYIYIIHCLQPGNFNRIFYT